MLFLLWLVTCAVIDFRYRKCFNWIVLSGLIILLVTPEAHFLKLPMEERIIGFFLFFFAFLIFYHFGVMGAGDVKFVAVLGLWVGWKLLLPIWVLSCLLAVVHGLFSRSALKYFFVATSSMKDGIGVGNKKFIPYVTYLSVATVIILGFYKNQ